ncbi:hypothetical protein Tsubulata_036575 [Turnera subulata]|uniref:Uncharacterized protein n=1 Tax=Turnera subulata TaxID=218843 RepID=A0A9Q0J385_9ROSI|nr:hypothetical protein Tsubulata_036575 [Turnera subulata]
MLKCSLDLISSQDSVKGIEGECFSYGEDQSKLINSYGDQKLEVFLMHDPSPYPSYQSRCDSSRNFVDGLIMSVLFY